MGVRRLAPALLLGAVLVGGCGSSSPADELRSKVAAVTDAANQRDANALRSAVDDLLATAKLQHDTAKLDLSRYRQIQRYAGRLQDDAASLATPTRTVPPSATAPTTTPVTTPPATSQPTPTGRGDGKGKGGKEKHDASPTPSLNPVLATTAPTVTASP